MCRKKEKDTLFGIRNILNNAGIGASICVFRLFELDLQVLHMAIFAGLLGCVVRGISGKDS